MVGAGGPSGVDSKVGVVSGVWSDVRGGEAEAASAVQGTFGAVSEAAGGQEGVLVLVGVGEVEGEDPGGGGSAVAQTHQFDAVAVGQFVVHVGELASVADVHGDGLRPGRAGTRRELLGEGGLGRTGM